jgi:glutamate-ammonia-ligase adenylyltransferase
MTTPQFLKTDLPDPASAERFLSQLTEKHPAHAAKVKKNAALLSDIKTLVSFSPLIAATLLQHPEHLWWLNRKRTDSVIRDKEELLESLARFTLTNSQVEPHVLLARFRRRELIRIFLRDIRRLATVAEITEEISNLADVILENALRLSRQELDNRFGSPLETDPKGRKKPAEICIVSLGKLGSRELNYSSDIDLLFIYSNEGTTSGVGTRRTLTNREYFAKLAENITRLVGGLTGEGAAYRVDLRLRPHGTIGPLAMSVRQMVEYYRSEALAWERQVLIRSRASAGSNEIFRRFFSKVESSVFSVDESVETALRNVRRSKQRIDLAHRTDSWIDVKLGVGGIREIEFIAQALQLAHGGRDKWLRAPHTLIILARLADRDLLTKTEQTDLFDAYDFLRHLEHILQMENGLQTHKVPSDPVKRSLIARRMNFDDLKEFDTELDGHMRRVNTVFRRVFEADIGYAVDAPAPPPSKLVQATPAGNGSNEERGYSAGVRKLIETSPRFATLFVADPRQVKEFIDVDNEFPKRNYDQILTDSIATYKTFGDALSRLRKTWSRLQLQIVAYDIFEKLSRNQSKQLQTRLAEATISAAITVAHRELERQYHTSIEHLPLAVLGLGKLGGAGLDYHSDLDTIFTHDSDPLRLKNGSTSIAGLTPAEFYSAAVEIFVTVLSSMTRDGILYRVDMRLRPFGKDGAPAMSRSALISYLNEKAAIWELLAYVKLRGVGGDIKLARDVEAQAQEVIRRRALDIDRNELATHTRRVRERLELEKSRPRSKDADIKFAPGGLLDVYFAIRYLQLRDDVRESDTDRSTSAMLDKLLAVGSLSPGDHAAMLNGYLCLTSLDHNIRLVVGRSTRLPVADRAKLEIIAQRMKLGSPEQLSETLALHRIAVRTAFENILSS